MAEKVDRLVLQYSKLTSSEKEELKRKIKEIDGLTFGHQRDAYAEKLEKSLGPLSSRVCDCCGR